MARESPSVSHLLFTDDGLPFFRANQEEYYAIVQTLRVYEKCSCQLINFEKSGVWFSMNTFHDPKEKVINALGIRKVIYNDLYLGFPIIFDRSQVKIFFILLIRFKPKSFIGTIAY